MAMAINSPSSGGGSGVGATTGGSGSGAISGNITNTNLNNDVDGSGTAATGNSDLWRECVDWLTRCKIIPSDHKATWPNAEIRVLALSLRDGVLLCNLVIHLDPTSMDQRDFNRKPQMAQFLCCQNIKLFLDVCRNHFGIREADLFDPTMLYDLTHFHRVLITLSKLSQCRKVQQLHPKLVGFNLQLSPSERSHSDEDIYRDLPSTTTDNVCNATVDDHINTKEEEVYQDLCALQRTSRSQITSTTSFEQRDYVIRELIDTESNYLDVLNALKEKFMTPLERYLKPEEINRIFPRIREIAEIHTRFLDKLRESLLPNTKSKMSQVFLEFREPFLIYGEYCSSMLGAIDYLADVCKKNQIIDQLVQQCERDYNVGKLQLRDILSVPMQRILKYHLLLDKLVKETSPMHEDYRSLERAKEAMIDVSQYINEVKRDSDHLVIIQKVKDNILDLPLIQNGSDLLQYGRLLLDGELHIKKHEDQKTKLRYGFVFDKILILAKPHTHTKTGDMQYLYRDSHNLADYRVEHSHSRRTLGRDNRFKWQLLLARKSAKTAFTLYLKSEPERDKWRKALTEAMDNIEPPGCRNTDHRMEIFTFDQATTCRHCSKFLKGRIHQGYRCRVCEIAVHKGCISSTGRCKHTPMSVPPPVCDRQLTEFNWFVGSMDRETAASRLENRRIGTYLLRVRPQGASNPHETMYALSLKTDDHVIKHMKINQEHEGDHMLYCLSSRRHFKTIVELVSYYERNDLGENFAGLNQSLQWPFREILATAIYDFEPKGINQLGLKTGCQVLVIGKDGDSKGWWRGKIGDTVGYFPKEYVQEHPPVNDDF